MTALDRELKRLAGLTNGLPRQSQVALFWAASSVHLESAGSWRDDHPGKAAVLLRAQDAAYSMSLGDLSAERAAAFLRELDQALPDNVLAQSSWICADAALRVIADSSFESGMSIEYALEPVLGRTSEGLFGFWQVGGGEAEDSEVAAIMAQPDVVEAVEFCRWAVLRLSASDAPSPAAFEEVRARAAALSGT